MNIGMASVLLNYYRPTDTENQDNDDDEAGGKVGGFQVGSRPRRELLSATRCVCLWGCIVGCGGGGGMIMTMVVKRCC
jgi:hypothetical protein